MDMTDFELLLIDITFYMYVQRVQKLLSSVLIKNENPNILGTSTGLKLSI